MKQLILGLVAIFFSISLVAQEANKSSLSLSAYADTYYAFNSNESVGFGAFSTVSPRSNQIGLNIAQIGVSYEAKNIRSNIIMHYGDIVKATWSTDFPAIQEANIGVHLVKNWWLDLGFFSTHIGTESYQPRYNDLTTTSIITYSEPFYQGGAKLAYEGSDKYDLELWVVNGYNQFVDINKVPSVGLLFSYNLNDNHSLTYTNLFGSEKPFGINNSSSLYRTYHNLYYNGLIKNKVKITLGGDLSTQEGSALTNESVIYYAGLATIRLLLTKKSSISMRYEYFNDPDAIVGGVFINPENNSANGYKIQGFTAGYEFLPMENAYLRLEYRYLQSLVEGILPFDNNLSADRSEFIINMGTYFDKKW